MRLLLAEMYPPGLAEALRRRGHDAVAVTERPALRGLSDDGLFAIAQQERRAIVTENVADFVPIANQHEASGGTHPGLVLVPPGSYPRGDTRTLGRIVTAIDALGDRLDEGVTSPRLWL